MGALSTGSDAVGAARPPGGRRPLRLVFLGTPEAAVGPLRALHAAGHDIRLVVTQPDKRRGRGSAMIPSPVKAAAAQLGLPVSHRVDDVIDAGAELGVVVAFGKLIKPHVLAAIPMVNLHFSLLPRWRGAAPVERAILAGDAETGVCVMALEEGLDTGPVHACRVLAIGADETAEELRAALVTEGTELLLTELDSGLTPPVPQVGEMTYAAKVDPAEYRIDWTQPAVHILRVVRLGRAWTTFRGPRLRVLRARPAPEPAGPDRLAAGEGSLAPGQLDGLVVGTAAGPIELMLVQPEGRGAMAAAAWHNGARPRPGERFGP